jgi:hypothetical protein
MADKVDGGIPRASTEGWWRELADEGLLPKWSNEIYLAGRKVLEREHGLEIDDRYWAGHAKTAKFIEDEYCPSTYVFPIGERHTTHTYLMGGVVNETPNNGWTLDFDQPRPPPDG